MTGPRWKRAAAILDELHVPFVINQNRYSILDRTVEKNGLKETAAKLGKGIITFSPLAQGRLTDRYLHGIPADSRMHTDGRFLKESDLTPELLGRIAKAERPGRCPRPDVGRDGAGLAAGKRGDHQRADRRLPPEPDLGQHQGRGKHRLYRRRAGGDRPAERVRSIRQQKSAASANAA